MKIPKSFSGTAGRLLVALAVLLPALTGCTSTRRTEDEAMEARLDEAQAKMEKIETEEQDFDQGGADSRRKGNGGNRDADGVPILATVRPSISFFGRGVKVEFEDMLLTNFRLLADREASSGYATLVSDGSSLAEFSITLPAGRYECLLSEKARDASHATVSVSIGEDSFAVYPSNPPLGIWELTTRAPIYFTVAEEKSYLVTVSSAEAGMSLDYIQFVRME